LSRSLVELGSAPPSNTRFLGLTQVSIPNGISIGLAVFAWLTNVINRHGHTHRPTDRPRYSLCSDDAA